MSEDFKIDLDALRKATEEMTEEDFKRAVERIRLYMTKHKAHIVVEWKVTMVLWNDPRIVEVYEELLRDNDQYDPEGEDVVDIKVERLSVKTEPIPETESEDNE